MFTRRSRRALARKLIALDFRKDFWQFVTLTYPGEYASDPREWKRQLDVFNKALVRDWSDSWAGAIWRLERQARGAPHFHLLVCWRAEVPLRLFRTWTREHWTAILGGPPARANWVRTQVLRVEIQPDGGVTKLLHYLAKYLGKIDDLGFVDDKTGEALAVGRFWGEWGKLPYCAPKVYLLDAQALAELAERVRERWPDSPYMAAMTGDRLRGTFFGDGREWEELLEGISWDSSSALVGVDIT